MACGYLRTFYGYPRLGLALRYSGGCGRPKRAAGASEPRRVRLGRVAYILSFVNLTEMWLTRPMISHIHAFWALVGLNLMVFGWALYAHARVRANEKVLADLDWETLANLTGEVGAMKRSLQKVNNRINGMTASDPVQILNELPKLQNSQQSNGRIGG